MIYSEVEDGGWGGQERGGTGVEILIGAAVRCNKTGKNGFAREPADINPDGRGWKGTRVNDRQLYNAVLRRLPVIEALRRQRERTTLCRWVCEFEWSRMRSAESCIAI